MSLDKAIKQGREHRKEYYDSKRFDFTCRCHGSCGWCVDNRTITTQRDDARIKKELTDIKVGG